MKPFAALLGVVATLAVAPSIARADDDDDGDDAIDTDAPPPDMDDAWHADVMLVADLPLALSTFRSVASFGGGVTLRAYREHFEAGLETVAFAGQDTTYAERLRYRTRLLGGLRFPHGLSSSRSVIGRIDLGVELGGWDPVGSASFIAEQHRAGFAVEAVGESRSDLSWGVITLSVGVAASAQPFGDKSHVNYFGLELLVGAAVGF